MRKSKLSLLLKTALLLMAVFGLLSCSDTSCRDALQRAEALMETDPHAARAVLMEIEDGRLKIEDYPTAEGNKTDRDTTNQPPVDSQRKGKKANPQFSIFNFQSKRDAALYALLRTQADYKCRVRLTSDSLPLVATNLYVPLVFRTSPRKPDGNGKKRHSSGCGAIVTKV
ncbi:MAG: hypothetical protein IKS80_00710 [Bacteroidaceae bacterium]|nr:hypothetical protein [Bacteroidaceae bacterium]